MGEGDIGFIGFGVREKKKKKKKEIQDDELSSVDNECQTQLLIHMRFFKSLSTSLEPEKEEKHWDLQTVCGALCLLCMYVYHRNRLWE